MHSFIHTGTMKVVLIASKSYLTRDRRRNIQTADTLDMFDILKCKFVKRREKYLHGRENLFFLAMPTLSLVP